MNMTLYHNKYERMKIYLTFEHLLTFADWYELQKLTNPQNFA